MATLEKLTVILEANTARLKSGFDSAQRSADKFGRSFRGKLITLKDSVFSLRGAIAGVITAQAVRSVVNYADSYTELQNRLRVVTQSTEDLNSVTQDLLAISQQTRSSFQANVDLYSRLAIASKQLGLNQGQLLQFTESLNQAIKLSGATSAEANAALIQLSQGMASGTLRGDELRSVLEQLPAVADIIAKQLGVTRGELRRMGEEGQITADIIVDAFAAARAELELRFLKTVPTVSDSFVKLNNTIITLAGAMDEAFAGSGGLIDMINAFTMSITNNLKGIILFFKSVFGQISLVVESIDYLLTQIKDVGIAMKSLITGDFSKLTERAANSRKQFDDMADAFKNAFDPSVPEEFGDKLDDVAFKIKSKQIREDVFRKYLAGSKTTGTLDLSGEKIGGSPQSGVMGSLEATKEKSKETGESIEDSFKSAFRSIELNANNWKDSMASIFDRFADVAIDAITQVLQKQAQISFSKGGGGLSGFLSGVGDTIGKAAGSLFGEGDFYTQNSLPAPRPARAAGGAVNANMPYLVGERGAEMFVPNTSGSIATASRTRSMMGESSGVVVNNNFNISTGVSQTVRAELAQMMPQINANTRDGVIDAIRRGGKMSRAVGVKL